MPTWSDLLGAGLVFGIVVSIPFENIITTKLCSAQEKEDKADTWKSVAKHYKYAEVYALSWTACNAADFFDKGAYDPKEITSFRAMLNFVNLSVTVQRQY